MKTNKSSKNWTCAACRHIGKPHPLDSTDLCRSSSWKHQQSWNFLFLFLPQTRKRYIPAWVRKACNWCCNRKEEKPKGDKADPLSLSQHCNFHCCSSLWPTCPNSETLRFKTTHQGGITCEAIEEASRSSKAIDERDKNIVIAGFRVKMMFLVFPRPILRNIIYII